MQAAHAQHILVSTAVELLVNKFHIRCKPIIYYIVFCYCQLVLVSQKVNFRNTSEQEKKAKIGISCHKRQLTSFA